MSRIAALKRSMGRRGGMEEHSFIKELDYLKILLPPFLL
jgi:hypothetical protein